MRGGGGRRLGRGGEKIERLGGFLWRLARRQKLSPLRRPKRAARRIVGLFDWKRGASQKLFVD